MAHDQKSQLKVDDTISRRNKSRDWMRDSIWPEIEAAWKHYKCRVDPIIDPLTNQEDLTRTNVALPGGWIIGRKKSARMAKRPPSLRIRSATQEVSDQLSAWTAFQWDKAGEQRHQRKHVLQANLFGFSLKEHSYDEVVQTYRFRRSTEALLAKRGVIVKEDESGMSYELPGEGDENARPLSQFDETQKAAILSALAPETMVSERLKKYEGPVSNWVFLGDYYPEPEFEGVHNASFHIIQQFRNLEWLAYWANRTFKDPDSGQEFPVFSKETVQELVDEGSYKTPATDAKDRELKDRLLAVLNKVRPEGDLRLPGKRFLITKEYTLKNGWPHIRFIGNEKFLLTPEDVPLPWDLQGRYPLSGFVPIPDLISGFGDSSPRILRHLLDLLNVVTDQTVDYLNAVLKPLALVREGADIPGEIIDRGLLRILRVKNVNDYQIERMPGIPPEAFQMLGQIMRLLQMGEPAIIDFGPQSQAVPNSQRVATLGILQQRAQDALATDELEALSESLAEETTIKLLMLQQTLQEPLEFGVVPSYALAQGGGDAPTKFHIDPMEIQYDFEVFPEFGSTLGQDDQEKQKAATEMLQVAASLASVMDVREAARRYVVASGQQDPESLIKPPPEPGSQMPPVKINYSISSKAPDLPADVMNQLLALTPIGPSRELDAQQALQDTAATIEVTKSAVELGKEIRGEDDKSEGGDDGE